MPDKPSYNISFPWEWKSLFDRTFEYDARSVSSKAVQLAKEPLISDAFPVIVSINWPIVILLGIACGLIMISGFSPDSVKGIFSSGISNPIVPFWPHLEQNLSPMEGILSSRIRIFARRLPFSSLEIKVLSTIPSCPFFVLTDWSKYLVPSVDTFPNIIILSCITVSVLITPSLSKCWYSNPVNVPSIFSMFSILENNVWLLILDVLLAVVSSWSSYDVKYVVRKRPLSTEAWLNKMESSTL